MGNISLEGIGKPDMNEMSGVEIRFSISIIILGLEFFRLKFLYESELQ